VSSPLYVLSPLPYRTAHNQAVLLILQALFGAMTANSRGVVGAQMFGQTRSCWWSADRRRSRSRCTPLLHR
jgi:hypothetical protein